jgi:hypothetical protein
MTRGLGAVALLLALAAVSAAAVGAWGGSATSDSSAKRKPLRFEQHELYIEYNATDGDAGLQLAADAEDWERFTLLDTNGITGGELLAREGSGNQTITAFPSFRTK